jgi:hypothetical protein
MIEEEEKEVNYQPKPIIVKKGISHHGGGGGTRLSSLESLGERSIDN